MTVHNVTLCKFKGKCGFQHLKFNGRRHRWRNGLMLCTWNQKCNQQQQTNHELASRKYGIPKEQAYITIE